jgi:hypothetical protein
MGELQDALRLYRRAAEIDPNLSALRICLGAARSDGDLTNVEIYSLLPGFSLPRDKNIEARRFLDLVAAPNLSTVYTNDNMIVFQRALTFLREPDFMEAVVRSAESPIAAFDDRTWRTHILLWAARNTLKLRGDFVELGTFRARFAACIVDALDFGTLDRKMYLYDTFDGLPDDAVLESQLPASFYVDLRKHYSEPGIYESVCARFANTPNVTITRGKLPDTLRETCPERIAWLHVDLNSAVHEIASLEYLWDRIVVGGHIILDDYGFCAFPTQTAAHRAFFKSRDLAIAELPTGQGLVIKL